MTMDSLVKNKLLIVDDDTANLLELIDILKSEYKIYTAKNGISALEIAKKFLPDLILLDIIMPGMSGYEVLAELRKYDSTMKIPVIFVSGSDTSEDIQKGLSLGAVEYITKPYNRATVLEKVLRHIKILEAGNVTESR